VGTAGPGSAGPSSAALTASTKLKSCRARRAPLLHDGPFGGGDASFGEGFCADHPGDRQLSDVLEVYDFGFGKEAPGGNYPTIFIAGFVNNVWGIWQSDDEGQSWTQVGDLPLGSLDQVKAVEGDKNVYGIVYIGFQGSGYAYGGIGGDGDFTASRPNAWPGGQLPTLSVQQGSTSVPDGP
jgi:hypothetical protein